MANGKRRKNTIASILVDVEEHMELEKFSNDAISFFQSLYRKEEGPRPIIDNLFDVRLPMEQAGDLKQPFLEEEVHNINFSMDGSKALRPDGFSMFFLSSLLRRH